MAATFSGAAAFLSAAFFAAGSACSLAATFSGAAFLGAFFPEGSAAFLAAAFAGAAFLVANFPDGSAAFLAAAFAGAAFLGAAFAGAAFLGANFPDGSAAFLAAAFLAPSATSFSTAVFFLAVTAGAGGAPSPVVPGQTSPTFGVEPSGSSGALRAATFFAALASSAALTGGDNACTSPLFAFPGACRLFGPRTGILGVKIHPTPGTGLPPTSLPLSKSHGCSAWNSWNESFERTIAPVRSAMRSTNASPRPIAPAGGETTSPWSSASTSCLRSEGSMRCSKDASTTTTISAPGFSAA